MNFAKFCTCSSDMISEVNFSFQWQWRNFKISPVPLHSKCSSNSADRKVSIEIPSKLLPSSTTSRPFKSSPDILVVFQLQLIGDQNLVWCQNILTMVPNKAIPVTKPKVDIGFSWYRSILQKQIYSYLYS
jgi:hypothetical protein